MASTKASALLLRRCSGTTQTSFRCYQRRWAQVHDVRFFAAHQSPTKVQDRYKEKLDQKAREKGLKDVNELKEVYSEKIKELRQKAIVPGANAPLDAQPPTPPEASSSIPFQPPPPPTLPPSPSETSSQNVKKGAKVKTLSDFVDVEKLSALPETEIERVWRLSHVRDAQSLCALMPAATYRRIAAKARKHPQFILPIPREGQGAEIHFLQWTFPTATTATVLFTQLAEFKLRGEFAQPHTTVTHHLDLESPNGLVLLEGRVQENRGVSVDEGKWLLMCLQKFYGFEAHSEIAKENAESRNRLMEQFSGGDPSFKIEELLEQAEKVP